MRLTAPIYRLKRNARVLSRAESIPLHVALDRIAQTEGYRTWSLLASKWAAASPAATLLEVLNPGDLLLVGSRKGHGKTSLCLEIAIEAMKAGNPAWFFTLEMTKAEVFDLFRASSADPAHFSRLFEVDCSEQVNADHIARRLASAPSKTVVVVDYLQLLDQQRKDPNLEDQVRQLKTLARRREIVLILSAQIHRSYDPSAKRCPDRSDVRLPNPLDLSLFDKTCFLHNGEIQMQSVN